MEITIILNDSHIRMKRLELLSQGAPYIICNAGCFRFMPSHTLLCLSSALFIMQARLKCATQLTFLPSHHIVTFFTARIQLLSSFLSSASHFHLTFISLSLISLCRPCGFPLPFLSVSRALSSFLSPVLLSTTVSSVREHIGVQGRRGLSASNGSSVGEFPLDLA